MQKYTSKSDHETKRVAAKLAKKSKSNIFALSGELGSGKTIFVQGFAKALGIQDKIISPTFVLIRQHQIPNTANVLYHIDLYRLDNIKNLESIGLKEIISNPNHIVLIEWAEKALKLLPKTAVKIKFLKQDNNERIITITGN